MIANQKIICNAISKKSNKPCRYSAKIDGKCMRHSGNKPTLSERVKVLENTVRCSGLDSKKCTNKPCGISNSTLCRKHFMNQTIDDVIDDPANNDKVNNEVEVDEDRTDAALIFSDNEDEEDIQIKKFLSNQSSFKSFKPIVVTDSIETIVDIDSSSLIHSDGEDDDEDLEIKKFLLGQRSFEPTQPFESIEVTEPITKSIINFDKTSLDRDNVEAYCLYKYSEILSRDNIDIGVLVSNETRARRKADKDRKINPDLDARDLKNLALSKRYRKREKIREAERETKLDERIDKKSKKTIAVLKRKNSKRAEWSCDNCKKSFKLTKDGNKTEIILRHIANGCKANTELMADYSSE